MKGVEQVNGTTHNNIYIYFKKRSMRGGVRDRIYGYIYLKHLIELWSVCWGGAVGDDK